MLKLENSSGRPGPALLLLLLIIRHQNTSNTPPHYQHKMELSNTVWTFLGKKVWFCPPGKLKYFVEMSVTLSLLKTVTTKNAAYSSDLLILDLFLLLCVLLWISSTSTTLLISKTYCRGFITITNAKHNNHSIWLCWCVAVCLYPVYRYCRNCSIILSSSQSGSAPPPLPLPPSTPTTPAVVRGAG